MDYIGIDDYIIMPNHVHIIVHIGNPEEGFAIKEKEFQPRKRPLSIVIRNFKSTVTLLARRKNYAGKVWQQRFHDRMIRKENELQRIRKYIRDNPMRWAEDGNNTENLLM